MPPRVTLTAAQRGIWYAQQRDPENPTYQVGQYLELDGQLDLRLLSIAWTKTVRDIDALSMRFDENAEGPYATLQRPGPAEDLIEVVDLRSSESQETARREALDRMDDELTRARALAGSDLHGIVLFRLPSGGALMFQRVHHIMLDGYSAVITLHYLARVYTELSRRAPRGIAVGPVASVIARLAARTPSPFPSHAELMDALQEYEDSAHYAEDEEFWRHQVDQENNVVGLEGSPSGPARDIVRTRIRLTEEQAASLRELGRELPRTMVGVIAVYLSRMTGQERVSLGLPVTARRGRVTKSTPSMLSNILPLYLDVDAQAPLQQTIRSAGQTVRETVRHQRYRVETLASAPSHAGPSVNLLPVVNDLQFGRATGSVNILATGPVHDLSVVISGLDSDAADPTLQLEADAALHTQERLLEHAGRIRRLITDVLSADAGATVGGLRLMGPEEADRQLRRGAGPQNGWEPETVLQAFSSAVAAHPDQTAVVATDGRLTYGELDSDSTRLAHHLRRRGVGSTENVAVRIERSVNLPLLVLAVLKAGGAYVPLDPEYPVGRVSGMIEDSSPALMLTSRRQATEDRAAGAEWAVPTLAVDADTEQQWRRRTDDQGSLPPTSAEDLAYVIFTSGSTGRPKGVGVERLALRNLFEEHRAELFAPAERRLGRRARVAHTAGLSFDAAWDPLLWLFAGHELHIIDDDVRRDPQRLAEHLSTAQIDAVETTPSFVEALLATGLLTGEGDFSGRHRPTVVAVGGEDIDPDLWQQLSGLPGVSAYNLYGPTEATVDSLVAPVSADVDPHIGSSVRNSRHYIVDAGLHPVPDRAVGELYLAGSNVARGYVGQPGMSAANFVADPFAADGSRMYRTGDVVRRRGDGSLRFLGRADDQVKIRGHRVELSEVEAALRRRPEVNRAAALVHGEAAGARLTGYITVAEDTVSGDGGELDGHTVKEQLRHELPDYMVPSTVMVLAEFPLTPNGKLDRQALPGPRTAAAEASQRPRTAMQRTVVTAFAQTLDLDPAGLGVDADFFAAGGHSLLATQLAAELSSRIETQVRVRDVFECPTVFGLAERLGGTASSTGSAAPLKPMARPDPLPVSLAQRRLWFLNRLEPASAAYNIPVTLELSGPVDVAALRGALADVAARHEPLRTIFPMHHEEPIQEVLDVQVGRPHLTAVEIPAERVEYVIGHESRRPFDITAETPLRAVLLTTGHQQHTLLVVMHHIAADGWSLTPFARDLSAGYAARTKGHDPNFGALDVTYADFALWQREHLGDSEHPDSEAHAQAQYWQQALSGAPEEIALPRDRARGAHDPDRNDQAEQQGMGERRLRLDPGHHAALRRLAADHRVSLFMVLQSALAVTLKQQGAGEDIVMGTPVAGRGDPQLDELVGFFVNTLVLRTSLENDPQLVEVLERVRENNTSAYAHQDLPFDTVVDAVNPARTALMHPIFQVMLTLQNTEPAVMDLADVEVSVPPQMTSAGVKVDLMVDVSMPEGEAGPIEVALGYDRAIFDPATGERISAALGRVLEALVQTPHRRVSDLPVVDPQTERRLHRRSRAERVPSQGTILDALQETAGRHPDRTALADPSEQLSYRELLAAVETTAAGLCSHGAQPGDRVVIAMPRGVRAITSLLGALRASTIAVPVDIDYPAARIAQIMNSSAPSLLIVEHTADLTDLDDLLEDAGPVPRVAASTLTDLVVDAGDPDTRMDLPDPPAAEDAAYLVYTSGTTGTPKGVQVPHAALQNVLTHHRRTLIGPQQRAAAGDLPRMLHLTGLGFDAAWDPILWLCAGTTVVFPPEQARTDAEAVVSLLTSPAGGADVVETTPSYAQQLITVGLLDALQASGRTLTLALGGEAVPTELWQTIAASPDVFGWNLYGPSEFTVDSVMGPITGETPHLGDPIVNVTARVLDSSLVPAPPGVEGELYLSGLSAAHGYWRRPDETASRFVADPCGDGARMYRTGDIVRRRAGGALEFLRRDDDQVTIRGHRIEVGEVESVLAQLPGIESAVVRVVTPGGAESTQLVAWVVGENPPEDIRRAAASRLPEYMVPTRITPMTQLPLTTHGKVDVEALPAPQARVSGTEPRTEWERSVCALMGEVLAIEAIGLDDDFFALGGHSLLAVTLLGRLQEELGISVPLRTIFEATTPAQLLQAAGLADEPAVEDQDVHASPVPVDDGPAPQAPQTPQSMTAWVRSHPRDPQAELPLSSGQSRLWFLNRLDPDSADYNVVLQVHLEGDLDVDALSSAVDDLVGRHEVLRTTYPTIGDRPVQQIHEPQTGMLGETALDLGRGFDLTQVPPLRAALVRLTEETWRFELVIHHIATDGASLAPLVRDLSAAYTARVCGGAVLRRPLEVQYGDVARREQHERGDLAGGATDGTEKDPALARWAERLRGVPTELELPADGRRADAAEQPAATHRFEIPADVASRITGVAYGRAASSFHAWLAGLAGYLQRIGAGDDVVIGSPSAGRTDPEVEELIGFFVNTLPLRLQFARGSESFAEAVDQARRVTLAGLEDEKVPFEQIVETLRPERRLGRHPLFQTMLSVEQPADVSLELPGVSATPLEPESTGSAKVDLSFTLRPRGQGDAAVDGVLEYNAALFSGDRARGLVDRWLTFLHEVAAAAERPLIEAPMRGTATALDPPRTASVQSPAQSVLEAFDETVRRIPDETALQAHGVSLSYAELDQRIEHLTASLHNGGVVPGETVALCLPRSMETVAALLAVWRVGATVMPVDISLPAGRVASMLSTGRTRLVLHGESVSGESRLSAELARTAVAESGLSSVRTVSISELHDAVGESSRIESDPTGPRGSREHLPGAGEEPAYLIFTSGTTGRPKGVQVPHSALAHLLASHRATVLPQPGAPRARMAHTTGVGFDAAMDPILWLAAGHEIHLIDDQTRRDPQALVRLFDDHRITAWETTPSYVTALTSHTDLSRYLDSHTSEEPFTLLLGGEPVDPGLWDWLRRRDGTRSWNLYGPTEVGVDSMVAEITEDPTPHLGSPTVSTAAYVLDDHLRAVPDGSVGELWLAGEQLAHGYLGRLADTAAGFVPDPFAADGSRMYRTGDLVMVHGSSCAPPQVRLLGRADDQVKIRGHRIEPAEVESLLRSTGHVAQAVVRPRSLERGEFLVAWVVPHDVGSPGGPSTAEKAADLESELVSELQSMVPSYMVPSAVCSIEEMPLTTNGKIDERSLPEPDRQGGGGRPPHGQAEEAVAHVFAEVLDVDDVTAEDSFFELGGHSFLAPPTIRAVNEALGTELPIQILFQVPTVSALGAVALSGETDVTQSLRPVLPLRREGSAAPLFVVHPASGLSWAFASLLPHLPSDRPVLGLQMPGIGPDEPLGDEPGSLTEAVDAYVQAMRQEQPSGPYDLIGWSFGGRIAHAIAAALQEEGDEVRLLAALDAYPSQQSRMGVDDEQSMWRGFLAVNGAHVPTREELTPTRVMDLLERAESPLAVVPQESIHRMVRRFRALGALLDTARTPIFDGDLHVFEATEDVPAGRPGPEAWEPHVTGDVRVSRVPVAHEQMLSEEAVQEMAVSLHTLLGGSHR